VKLDLETGEKLQWIQKGIWASEPVFVPNPRVTNPAEDDGVILSNLLHEEDQNRTTLVVLDAKTMKELGKVEFKSSGPVSTTVHGQWATAGEKVHTY